MTVEELNDRLQRTVVAGNYLPTEYTSTQDASYIPTNKIKQTYNLTKHQAEAVRKRLSRWREKPCNEPKCMHSTDNGTGRFEWLYPKGIVEDMISAVASARVPKTG